jgi:hypothetical protein
LVTVTKANPVLQVDGNADDEALTLRAFSKSNSG